MHTLRAGSSLRLGFTAGGISVNEADQDDWATALRNSGMDTVHVTVYGKVTGASLHCQPFLWSRAALLTSSSWGCLS